MNRGLPVMALGTLLFCCAAAAAEDDPVKKKLDAAKVAYKSELENIGKAVTDWLKQREDTARKDGNKKQVDQVKAEMFEIRMRSTGSGIVEVFIGGAKVSAINWVNANVPQPGSAGVVLRKGSVTIKTIEVKEIK